jgi:hypothetical protein
MENLTEIEKQKFERAKKRVKAISGFYKHLMVYILVNLFLISLKFFNLDSEGKFLEFSTFSTAFFWGIGVAFHALSVFGPGVFLGNDWEEKKIREIMDKGKSNKWE